MKCPKCGSENVNVQVASTQATTATRGCLWSAGRVMLIIFTCGLWLLVGKSKGKTKIKNTSLAVCQNCGNKWKVG